MKLYTWTHFLALADREDWGDRPWVRQTTCHVVFKTDREFKERFRYGRNFKDYVQSQKVADRDDWTGGAKLAIDNPGTAYALDIWTHKYADRYWFPLPA